MEDISRVHLAQGPLTLIFTFTLGAALRLSKMFYVRPGRKFVLLHFLLLWPQVSSEGPPWTPVPPWKKKIVHLRKRWSFARRKHCALRPVQHWPEEGWKVCAHWLLWEQASSASDSIVGKHRNSQKVLRRNKRGLDCKEHEVQIPPFDGKWGQSPGSSRDMQQWLLPGQDFLLVSFCFLYALQPGVRAEIDRGSDLQQTAGCLTEWGRPVLRRREALPIQVLVPAFSLRKPSRKGGRCLAAQLGHSLVTAKACPVALSHHAIKFEDRDWLLFLLRMKNEAEVVPVMSESPLCGGLGALSTCRCIGNQWS